ncbi:MAG: GH3 auxin-responsive promoter family protein, partial [Streptosporangiales bacterium]
MIGDLLAVRTRRRMTPHDDAVAAQREVYRRLLPRLAATAFGRDHGLTPGLSYGDFRSRIQPRPYEGFAPYLERMKQGEADVLHPGRCAHFAVSSGTTAGPSKWLPVNAPLFHHFRQAGLDSLGLYARRAGSTTVFHGRHLFLGGSTALVTVPGTNPPIVSGDLSGLTALRLPAWAERCLYEPGRDIAQLTDWPAKLAAIAERTWRRDIRLVAGIPSWLLVLATALRAHAARETGREPATLRDIWPHLECLIHGGVPVGPFAHELRAACGPGVNFHEVYPASEAFIAAQDAEPEAGLRLFTAHGVFYEFIAASDYDENDPARSATRAVPLEGVRPGTDYVLLLTTPAGLVRYVLGDVVRFLSAAVPRLVYVGRTKLQLSAFGEHVIEKELTDTVTGVCQRHGLTLADFHVAPLFPDPEAGRSRGRHEWWLELRPPGLAAGGPDWLAAELDAELASRNDDYAAKRAGQGLEAPELRLVPPGFFEAWLRRKGKWGGQH